MRGIFFSSFGDFPASTSSVRKLLTAIASKGTLTASVYSWSMINSGPIKSEENFISIYPINKARPVSAMDSFGLL